MLRVLAGRLAPAVLSGSVPTLLAASIRAATVSVQPALSANSVPTFLSLWTRTFKGVPDSTQTADLGNVQKRAFAAEPAAVAPNEQEEDYALFNAEGDGRTYGSGYVQAHAGLRNSYTKENYDYLLMHPVYTREYAESVKPTHKPPTHIYEWVGYIGVQFMRRSFDLLTGYGKGMTEQKWLFRMLFLETVAGVPGMVGAMLRHLKSLRTMRRDHGWIHTLLEEAENERMHLLTFLQMRNPGLLFRGAVLLTQGIFFNGYMLFYLLWPRMCHSFVGYLEEEAVKTYTKCIEDIDAGKLPLWENQPAPDIAKGYWHLAEDATMRDLFLAVRADEASHKHVNHTFSELSPTDTNPFSVGSTHVP